MFVCFFHVSEPNDIFDILFEGTLYNINIIIKVMIDKRMSVSLQPVNLSLNLSTFQPVQCPVLLLKERFKLRCRRGLVLVSVRIMWIFVV